MSRIKTKEDAKIFWSGVYAGSFITLASTGLGVAAWGLWTVVCGGG